MTKKQQLIAVMAAALAGTSLGGAASAAEFVVFYTGTDTAGNGDPFTTTLTVDVASDGAVATFVSGNRNGVAIAGLNGYAGADNTVSFSNPYVTFGGLSFFDVFGVSYNFFANGSNYFEANSIQNPPGNTSFPFNPVRFASVNGVPITGVPEASTWAMMVAGFGLAGAALRRRQRTLAVGYA